jgi:type VI secretion system secreted protein VgrG
VHVVIRAEVGSAVVLRNSEIEKLEITQELSAHTRCHLHFLRDKDTDLHLDALLGQPLTVSLQDEIGVVTAFTGFVLEGSQGHQLNHGSSFTLEGVSHSWNLERRQTAYYTANKLGDILGRFSVKLSGQAPSREPLQYVQFSETDWDFLVRVADDHGMFVRTSDPKPEARAGFEETGLPLKWGKDLLGVTASSRTTPHAASGAAHRPEEKRDHRFRNVRKPPVWLDGAPRLTTIATKLSDRASNAGAGVVQELPFRSPTLADARKALEQESERALGASLRVEGHANNIRIRAGDTVKLEESEAFALPTQGTLGVVKVVHRFDGQQYSNDFVATPWSTWSNAARPVRSVAAGCTTGQVVDNVDPASMGRLKVRFRWNDSDESTRWTRMSSMYAGNMRGIHFLPEVGDEVLVMFEHGDIERPIVIGSLWNGADKAPTMEKNDAKRIVTRSGNTIQLYDEDGDERIEIYTAEGKCWMQLHNNKGKPLITIHSEGDISLEAEDEIRLKCTTLVQDVSSDSYRKTGGDDTTDVAGSLLSKAGGKHATEGLNVVVKAGMMLDAVAGGIHSIVGAMVHIQPPGKVVPPNLASAPKSPKSAWKKGEVPKKGEGRTSADPKVGR